jgi:sigma-E factor negative regulatory protein RseC
MLYQRGIVAEIRGQMARVEFIRSGSCGGCSGNQGCGLGPLLAMLRPARPHSLEIDISCGGASALKVGDTVRIAMAGNQLLKIVSLAYLLPLLGMLSGALLASRAVPDAADIGVLAGALSGLFGVSGLLALSGVGRAGSYLRQAQLQPVAPPRSGAD